MIVGFDGVEMSARLSSLLRRLQPAGVILFARNIKSPEQTWRLLQDCRKCVSTPLFTCVDLEGGSVDRFRDALGSAPSAADVFATRDRKLFRKHGQVIGENCRLMGFNVDFAPVLDLAFEASRSVMGSRAVSANPREVVTYVREFLAGLGATKVLGCGKHFPGLGEGNLDSHHELPVIEKSMRTTLGGRPGSLPDIAAAVAACDGVARGLSDGDEDENSRFDLEDVDHGCAPQEDWLRKSDCLGRSGDGRSAFCSARG